MKYAIFGGFALNMHELARFTEDIDIFLAADRENIGRFTAALKEVFDDPEIDAITADDLLGDYPAVQYVPPSGTFHIDILTRLGELYRFEDLETTRAPYGELTVTVVTPAMLYRMKRDTVRLKDRADAELLKRQFKLDS